VKYLLSPILVLLTPGAAERRAEARSLGQRRADVLARYADFGRRSLPTYVDYCYDSMVQP
jgi:hypothetical protein